MNKLQAILLGIRLTGLPNSLRALSYTRKRDKLEAKFPLFSIADTAQQAGKLISSAATPDGATFKFENNSLTVHFLAPDFLFLAWDGASMTPSYAVEKTDWPGGGATLNQSEWGMELKSDAIKLIVTDEGELLFYDAENRPLRQEGQPLKAGGGWQHKVALTPEACIYGLGEKAAGLNLRPGNYRCWNSDPGGSYGTGKDPLYIGMPVYMCLQDAGAYLAFYDNSYACSVTLDGSASLQFEGGPLRYYLAFGNPSSVVQRYAELTGRPPLPPLWALGYQQSYWGYGSEAEMRRVFKGFQDNKLPLSVLHMDIDFMDGYRVFTPDLKRYPDLPGFAAELEKAGVHLVAITDPGVKIDPGFDLYTDGLKAGAFCLLPDGQPVEGVVWPGWVVYPDFTDPSAREWWGRQYTRIFKYGISGIWHDMNEPVSYTAWGDNTLPICSRHELDGEKGDHRQAHNVYGMLMNKAGYDGMRKLKPDKRPFIVTRSGWAGMQRYSWCWTGDVETSWQSLRQTIPSVLGLGLSGMPYSGPDTGGFSGHPTPELYLRWFQLTSFLPFFRTHCAFFLPRREPWEFGPDVVDLVRSQLELRYRLMPYWYTLAYMTSITGEPVIRPLFWEEPDNRELWNIQDSFLAGDSLLIAPVMEEGSDKRSIRAPKGSWYELNGDTLMDGNGTIVIAAPLDKLPVLVRSGSILPMLEDGKLVLHVYRPQDGEPGSGQLYSDAGDGYGPSRIDTFNLSLQDNVYEISWTSGGEYPWPYGTPEIALHGFAGKEIRLQRR